MKLSWENCNIYTLHVLYYYYGFFFILNRSDLLKLKKKLSKFLCFFIPKLSLHIFTEHKPLISEEWTWCNYVLSSCWGNLLLRIFTVRIFAARIFTVEDYHDTPAWCQIHFWLVRNSVSAKKWLIYIIKNWWIIIHQKTKILSLVIFDIHKREKYMNQKLAPLRKSITLKKKKTEVLISKIDSSIFFWRSWLQSKLQKVE